MRCAGCVAWRAGDVSALYSRASAQPSCSLLPTLWHGCRASVLPCRASLWDGPAMVTTDCRGCLTAADWQRHSALRKRIVQASTGWAGQTVQGGAGRCRAVQGGQSIRQASAAANHGSWDGRTLSSNIFLRCLPACPPAVQEAVREAVGERYLQALVEAGSFPEAAALCPRVLKVSCRAYRACRALQEAAHLQRGSPRY